MIKRLTYTVVFRESNSSPQEEFIRYTQQAADSFAKLVQDNGGVAIVVEGDEDTPEDDNHIPRNPGELTWG